MMISIGDKHFIESDYIVEILKAADNRAARITHTAAESGRLINATGGRRIRSIIKLKSKHTVLSALRAETLKSRLGNNIISPALRNSGILGRKHKNNDANESKSSEFNNHRIEPDRRRFSYTRHIPERRSGIERRNKDRR
jgi:regulator of extracellular matrix RemA (YlzA/DUF370 family)